MEEKEPQPPDCDSRPVSLQASQQDGKRDLDLTVVAEAGAKLAQSPGFGQFCRILHEKIKACAQEDLDGLKDFLCYDDYNRDVCKQQLQVTTEQLEDSTQLETKLMAWSRQDFVLPRMALVTFSFAFDISVKIFHKAQDGIELAHVLERPQLQYVGHTRQVCVLHA